jgi:hypothetical protein
VANSNIPFGSNTDHIAVVLSMFIAIIVHCPCRIILTNTAREYRRY